MNDQYVELRLEQLLGRAPLVAAPAGLRTAVQVDRAAHPFSLQRVAGHGPAIATNLTFRARPIRSAVIGLAACLVVAIGLLFTLSNRTRPTATAGADTIDWHVVGQLAGLSAVDMPAVIGERLYTFGAGGVRVSVDGTTWTELAPTSTFGGQASGSFVGAVDDGRGGIVAVARGVPDVQPCATATCPIAYLDATAWHSRDAVAWTKTTIPGADITAVARNSAAIVLGGATNTNPPSALAMYSSDGTNWRPATIEQGAGAVIDQVVVVADTFLAIGRDSRTPRSGPWETSAAQAGSFVWRSSDGQAWTRVSMQAPFPSATPIQALGPRLAAFDGRTAWWSDDAGNSWHSAEVSRAAASADGSPPACYSVANLGSSLVCIGIETGGSRITPVAWMSSDGAAWRPVEVPSNLSWMNGAAAFGFHGGVVAFGNGNVYMGTIRAADKPTPTGSATAGPSSPFRQATGPQLPLGITFAVSYVAGRFYAVPLPWVSIDGPQTVAGILSSPDGSTWQFAAGSSGLDNPGSPLGLSIVSDFADDGRGGVVAVGGIGAGYTRPTVWLSSDGVAWRRAVVDTAANGLISHVARGTDRLVSTTTGGQLLVSNDAGETWQVSPFVVAPASGPAAVAEASTVVWLGDHFVLIGGARAWASPDGGSWAAIPVGGVPEGGVLPDEVRVVGERLVTVGSGGHGIYWSEDGGTWHPAEPAGEWSQVAASGTVAIALDNAGGIWRSIDGRTWERTELTVPDTSRAGLPRIGVGGGKIVALVPTTAAAAMEAWFADLPK